MDVLRGEQRGLVLDFSIWASILQVAYIDLEVGCQYPRLDHKKE